MPRRRYFSPPDQSGRTATRRRAGEDDELDLSPSDILGLVLKERDRQERSREWEMENARRQEEHDAAMLAHEASLEKVTLYNRYKAEVDADAANALGKLITLNPSSPDFDSDLSEIARLHSHGLLDPEVKSALKQKIDARDNFNAKWFPGETGHTAEGRSLFVETDPQTGRRFYSQQKRDAYETNEAGRKIRDTVKTVLDAAPPGSQVHSIYFDGKEPRVELTQPRATMLHDHLFTALGAARSELSDAEKRLQAGRLLSEKELPWQGPDKAYYRIAKPGEKGQTLKADGTVSEYVVEPGKTGSRLISKEEYAPYAAATKLLGPGFDQSKVPEMQRRYDQLKATHDALESQLSALTQPTTNQGASNNGASTQGAASQTTSASQTPAASSAPAPAETPATPTPAPAAAKKWGRDENGKPIPLD